MPARPALKCVNLVATADLYTPVDLSRISRAFDHVEYDPEYYHALIHRPPGQTVRCLVNASGKVVLTAAKDLKECRIALETLADDLRFLGYDPRPGNIQVRNMVFTGKFSNATELRALRSTDEVTVTYDAQRFPGAKIHFPGERGGMVLLFRSGAFNVVGCISEEEAMNLVSIVKQLVIQSIDSETSGAP